MSLGMIKKWSIEAVAVGGKTVTLYTVTNPTRIEEDLNAGPSSSFILHGRSANRRANPTEHTDHLDLATGAFEHYATLKQLSLLGISLNNVLSEIPKDLPEVWMGGAPGGGSYVISVYEQRQP